MLTDAEQEFVPWNSNPVGDISRMIFSALSTSENGEQHRRGQQEQPRSASEAAGGDIGMAVRHQASVPIDRKSAEEQPRSCQTSSSGECRVVAMPAGVGSTGEPTAAVTAQRRVILS